MYTLYVVPIDADVAREAPDRDPDRDHEDSSGPDSMSLLSPRIARRARLAGALVCLAACNTPAQQRPPAAQSVAVPLEHAQLRQAIDAIRTFNEWTLRQQIELTEIEAPPFKETRRGEEFKRRLEALGLRNVRVDPEGNVIGERPGTGSGPTVVLSGHLDTVFPEGTNVKVTRSGTRLSAPGIGDDGRGLAVVLAVARAFRDANVQTPGTILFVGTVGEEGPGNLRGVRALFNGELKGRIDYFISVDGTGFGVTSAGVGSHRYRVTYKGPGGHSYGAFGMPNPIHALGRAIALFADVHVPEQPKTTFNVGVIGGGTSVNSISAEGIMDVDMRSESKLALDSLDRQFRRALQQALDAENARWPRSRTRLTVQIDTIGIRPVGAQPDSAYIVRTAVAAGRALGQSPATGASSTDANLPISLGIPAITIDGGGRGSGAHALQEWYDDGMTGYQGPQWAAIVTAMLAGLK
jgi:acetylornithine deacetylase/succinyl-diaminopimelate desuccinylase-like protein